MTRRNLVTYASKWNGMIAYGEYFSEEPTTDESMKRSPEGPVSGDRFGFDYSGFRSYETYPECLK
jgi:hypothetical protein